MGRVESYAFDSAMAAWKRIIVAPTAANVVFYFFSSASFKTFLAFCVKSIEKADFAFGVRSRPNAGQKIQNITSGYYSYS